jgi:hypothetical protein
VHCDGRRPLQDQDRAIYAFAATMAEAPYPSIKKHRHCDDPAARTIADPVWFGIMVILVTWIALIPLVGVNLFVLWDVSVVRILGA